MLGLPSVRTPKSAKVRKLKPAKVRKLKPTKVPALKPAKVRALNPAPPNSIREEVGESAEASGPRSFIPPWLYMLPDGSLGLREDWKYQPPLGSRSDYPISISSGPDEPSDLPQECACALVPSAGPLAGESKKTGVGTGVKEDPVLIWDSDDDVPDASPEGAPGPINFQAIASSGNNDRPNGRRWEDKLIGNRAPRAKQKRPRPQFIPPFTIPGGDYNTTLKATPGQRAYYNSLRSGK